MTKKMDANLAVFAEQILQAQSAGQPLVIQGGGSKRFYGEQNQTGNVLSTLRFSGIVGYEPSELVITAKCGTPLAEIEQTLAQQGQMLGFEPPHFGPNATIGGCVSAGLSGPRRAAAGAVRDFVLGAQLLNAGGEHLNFGGQVMKNVAGYDVSRLLCGAMGTLGLITQVSLKVLPVPIAQQTRAIETNQTQALTLMNQWAGQPLPISASTWVSGHLFIRLSGSQVAIDSASKVVQGELLANADSFWTSVREQTHVFFQGQGDLWRVSVPSVAPAIDAHEPTLIEWNGAQRWFIADGDINEAQSIRKQAKQLGGHAQLFKTSQVDSVPRFETPSDGVMQLNRAMKSKFDPQGIFNPGRMFATI